MTTDAGERDSTRYFSSMTSPAATMKRASPRARNACGLPTPCSTSPKKEHGSGGAFGGGGGGGGTTGAGGGGGGGGGANEVAANGSPVASVAMLARVGCSSGIAWAP